MLTTVPDQLRARLLRIALRPEALRRLYSDTPARLFAGFVVACALYLPLALWRPDLLLFLGPLVYGYPHLVASYRFAPACARLGGLGSFAFLAGLTALALGAGELGLRFGWLPEMPFGAWELSISTVAVVFSRRRVSQAAACAAAGFVLWKLSWQEPLLFAASALLAHNWIALAIWWRDARGARARSAVLGASALFGAVHLLVYAGWLDAWLASDSVFGRAEMQTTAGVLSPWSANIQAWCRAVVLYTFGLSIHYYVWLKAIPECQGRVPLSWRRTLAALKEDLGSRGLVATAALAGAGILVWIAAPPLGARIYFRLATLHGWLEILFLASAATAIPVQGSRELTRIAAGFLPTRQRVRPAAAAKQEIAWTKGANAPAPELRARLK